MPTLYIIGTPIGNLEDLTRRAARVLGQVSLIAAEDTRVTRKLLSHLGLHAPLTSYHRHNWQSKLPVLLAALESGDVALATDAGMPGISDPGSELVAAAAAAGFRVEVIPGVSAVTAAIAASGLSGDAFLFLGFLPRRGKERRAHLASVAASPATLVIFEAPHRVPDTLVDLLVALGDRQMAACREMTKLHEEVFRGSISAAIPHFAQPRGEFTLVVAGAGVESLAAAAPPDLEAARQELARLRQSGARAREAVAKVSQATGLPRRTVYQLWLDAGSGPGI
ncbi:MAG: 16S rRNA (cytidine(1402)-2'-O)-methyltransferase [Dehalococcoidia bacterium]|nr:16S rRNA (cytidine(1402)-2'-O)-methyltransferase [Dehalococcoidia bacterium]MSQ17868.1 16S rRNA (cytidine(1402)-2'-O)-methyltransferase [Dehalococcoidia bacterium]